MNTPNRIGVLLALLVLATACSKEQPANDEAATPAPASDESSATPGEQTQIVPGLDMRVLREGDGPVAEPGQVAVVHYTGWLYDPEAENNRGEKFDSSVDRGAVFRFPLGAGRVIRGWDQGVAGMQVGEVRELTIAPELAYGERGAGGVIPPGATLVFEVELKDLEGRDEQGAATQQES